MASRLKSRAPLKEPVITLSAGPCSTGLSIQRAWARPVEYDFDPWFQDFYEQVTKKAAKAMPVVIFMVGSRASGVLPIRSRVNR